MRIVAWYEGGRSLNSAISLVDLVSQVDHKFDLFFRPRLVGRFPRNGLWPLASSVGVEPPVPAPSASPVVRARLARVLRSRGCVRGRGLGGIHGTLLLLVMGSPVAAEASASAGASWSSLVHHGLGDIVVHALPGCHAATAATATHAECALALALAATAVRLLLLLLLVAVGPALLVVLLLFVLLLFKGVIAPVVASGITLGTANSSGLGVLVHSP